MKKLVISCLLFIQLSCYDKPDLIKQQTDPEDNWTGITPVELRSIESIDGDLLNQQKPVENQSLASTRSSMGLSTGSSTPRSGVRINDSMGSKTPSRTSTSLKSTDTTTRSQSPALSKRSSTDTSKNPDTSLKKVTTPKEIKRSLSDIKKDPVRKLAYVTPSLSAPDSMKSKEQEKLATSMKAEYKRLRDLWNKLKGKDYSPDLAKDLLSLINDMHKNATDQKFGKMSTDLVMQNKDFINELKAARDSGFDLTDIDEIVEIYDVKSILRNLQDNIQKDASIQSIKKTLNEALLKIAKSVDVSVKPEQVEIRRFIKSAVMRDIEKIFKKVNIKESPMELLNEQNFNDFVEPF